MTDIYKQVKYYTTYPAKVKTIQEYPVIRKDKKKGGVVRGTYDIETNNDEGRFIVGGLALYNFNDSSDVKENYNIYFHNKPYEILHTIFKHNKQLGGYNKYEIAIHNLAFDIQSFIYNMLEENKITYKEPGKYGCQERNTYSIIMNERKVFYSLTVNYCGINIIFWDTQKLYPTSLSKLGEIYQLKYRKLESTEDTYSAKNFDSFCRSKKDVEYLINDLISLAELVDKNLYKKKTASANAWDNMQKEICLNLGLKKKNDKEIATLIKFWGDNRLNDYCLPAYSGGFCYMNPKHAGHTFKDVLHLDINSSYPNAMDKLDLPLTHYTSNKIECDRYLIFIHGEFDLKENSFPIIKNTSFQNDYLNHFKGNLLLTDIEYKRIQKNYNIKDFTILEVMNFPKCEKVLKSFVERNYEIKQNATGFLREKAKLNLNSAYGKLAEHHTGQFYCAEILNDKINYRVSDDTLHYIQTERSRCVIWAMFITAYAREKLYRCMDILGDNFLYTDTDSIFTDLPDEEVRKRFESIGEEIHDSNLGAWAIEGHSKLFKGLRAKCYLKTDNDPKHEPNVYRLNYVVAGYNGTDMIKGYVNEDISKIPAKDLQDIFINFRIGAKFYDKETSVMNSFGIKQVKVKTEYEIKEKVNIFEFARDFRKVD